MNDVVDNVGRVGVGRGAARGDAAPLINGHIDDDGAWLHEGEVFAAHEVRRASPRNEHAADHKIRPAEPFADRVAVGVEAVDVGGRDVVEVAESLEVCVEESNVGPEPGCHLGGIGSHRARAEHKHVGRGHARHATEQDAASHLWPLEIFGPLLDAHSPRHFAHRDQERQPAGRVAERLVGDGRAAGGQKALREWPRGRKMKVGKQGLTRPHELELRRLRLLHLHDEIGPAEDVPSGVDKGRAGGSVGLVGKPRAQARGSFHDHLVASPHEFLGTHWQEADAVFVPLRLPRNPDDHDWPSFVTSTTLKLAGIGTE